MGGGGGGGVTPLYNHTGTCRNLGYTFCTLQSGFSGRFGTLSTCSGFLGMFSIVYIHKSQKRFTFKIISLITIFSLSILDNFAQMRGGYVRNFGLIISSPSGCLDYIYSHCILRIFGVKMAEASARPRPLRDRVKTMFSELRYYISLHKVCVILF